MPKPSSTTIIQIVRVAGSRRLAIPDYAGNNLFNTLGNIVANPRVGLLFIGFESGRTLQLSGRATVDTGQQELVLALEIYFHSGAQETRGGL